MIASSAARGAAGEEHVVDEDHDAIRDVDGNLGGAERLHRPQLDVVAVEGDVERTDGDLGAFELTDRVCQAASDGDATGVQADEHDAGTALVAFHDLVGDAHVGPAKGFRVEHAGAQDWARSHRFLPWEPHRTPFTVLTTLAGQGFASASISSLWSQVSQS